MHQGQTEVSISDLANACGVDSASAILNNPDITSVKEQEQEQAQEQSALLDERDTASSRGHSVLLL
jgi:hypothetical protein